jgi:hypothetical protein
MKTFKALSLITLALSFLIAPLGAQTAPPAQAQAEAARLAEQQQAAAQAASVNAQAQTQQEAALKAQEEQRKQIDASRKKAEAEQYEMEGLVKTYSLKYVNPNDLVKAAKFYLYDSTASGSTLTVRIPRKYVADFEALLKKLDVEKKNIQLQVYTIFASKTEFPKDMMQAEAKEGTSGIEDKELKKVLDELKSLWNFRYYFVESPSFLVVKDGSSQNSFKLVSSRYNHLLQVADTQIRGEETGKRIISIGRISLDQEANFQKGTIIQTSDITFRENGYLVVGVSGSMGSGLALILVISAIIK